MKHISGFMYLCYLPDSPAFRKPSAAPKLFVLVVATFRCSQDHCLATIWAGIIIPALLFLNNRFDMPNVISMGFNRWF
jgi:predicted membrane-bound dolichyl-phosphate-mannose-protein mannosyltransferase